VCDQATFGPHHPTIATDLNNLGRAFLAIGDESAARRALGQAKAILADASGSNDPSAIVVSERVDALERPS
jgi:hypothetical protein